MESPLVSIIIPVYNNEDTLSCAIQSACNQTYTNIEIIVVDDGSTDKSQEITRSLASHDERIHPIAHRVNKRSLEARRTGVTFANSDYLLFLDADDELRTDAVEVCLKASNYSFDIVHFGTELVFAHYASEETKRASFQFCQPANITLAGDDITHAIYRDGQGPWSLWGKLMKTDLVKEAFTHVPEAALFHAEDACIFFLISYFAQTYQGIPDYLGYVYHIDIGRSDALWKDTSLDRFEQACCYADAMEIIRNFIEERDAWDRFQEDYDFIMFRHAQIITSKIAGHLPPQLQPQALSLFVKHWGKEDVAVALIREYWRNPAELWKTTGTSSALSAQCKDTKTVGVYYFRLGIGGAEHVVYKLVMLWLDMGYRVVVFTDQEPQAGDYPLPDNVTHIVLPTHDCFSPAEYELRSSVLMRELQENSVDAFIYCQWNHFILPWDMLITKLCGIPFIVYTQTIFAHLYSHMSDTSLQFPQVYRYLDGLIVLSKTDKTFWEMFCSRVWQLPNPVTIPPDPARRSLLDSNEIVWVGRLSNEDKQPLEALLIMERVIECNPQAHLTMVGPWDNESTKETILQHAAERNLTGHVTFAGPQANPFPFYQNASVYLLTSSTEGWCLTLAESKAVGLPCVMYELPFLELTQNNRGIIAVPHFDHEAAATAICKLLEEYDTRKRLGDDAFDQIQELASFDHKSIWSEILQTVQTPLSYDKQDDRIDLMWDTLIDGCLEWWQNSQQERYQKKQEIYHQTQEIAARDCIIAEKDNYLADIRASTTWRVGSLITAIPRAIKDVLSKH